MANKIEQIKAAKDGLDVLPDLHRYAAQEDPEFDPDDFERLKWYGLFHRKATPGHFMLRLRIPNGILTSEQLAAIGRISEEFGRNAGDITSRQNIQLRWIRIQDAPAILQRITAAGLTTQQSGMDNVRNIVGCPLAGLDADELYDASGLAGRLQQAIIGLKSSEGGFSNLPRKFNLSITGCRDDCTSAQVHDLSFTPATRGGAFGFNVLVGGALGGKMPKLAEPLDAWVPPDGVVDLATAVLGVFRDHGPRESRKMSRLKVLLGEWGIERFRAEVERAAGTPLARAGEDRSRGAGGDHVGCSRQRDGRTAVGLLVPVGRIRGGDLIELGRLAKRYGGAEARLTVQQNLIIPHVPDERLDALLAEPLLQRYQPQPSGFTRGLVACTGIDYCHFSLIDTKEEALALARALDERYEAAAPIRIHWSGCPHACGQHKIADVGLEGARVRTDEGAIVPAASVVAGGRLGAGARMGTAAAGKTPVGDLPELVAAQIAETLGTDAIRPLPAPATA